MSMQNNDEVVLSPEEQRLDPDTQAKLRLGRTAQRDLEIAQRQLAEDRKQMAIERAGVPDHPARELVFQSYTGPLEPDAIKAFAESMGIVAAPVTATPTISAEELAAQRAILSAGSGGGAPASGDVDAAVAMRNTQSPEELMKIVGELAGRPTFRSQNGQIGVLPEY